MAGNRVFGENRHNYGIPATMSVIALIVAVFQPEASSFLQYRNDFHQSGEVWRLVSAHFVHLDWSHLLLNLSGLWLLWSLVGRALNTDQWLLLIVLLSVSITVGLKVVAKEVDWYVGLSGLLYGMLSLGLVVKISEFKSPLTLVLALVLLKAAQDSLYGPLTLMAMTDQRVVADAHTFGVLGVAAWLG